MNKNRLHRKHIPILLLLFTLLACNAPILSPSPTLAPPPTFAPIRVNPIDETNDSLVATATSSLTQDGLPTFTPRLSATAATNAITTTPTPEATVTLNTEGEFSFTYTIEWQLHPDNNGQAIATVTFSPIGGGGGYQYFRDEQPVTGPVFNYIWASCAGNPGSLRVTSADGQSLKIDYFENPPCP